MVCGKALTRSVWGAGVKRFAWIAGGFANSANGEVMPVRASFVLRGLRPAGGEGDEFRPGLDIELLLDVRAMDLDGLDADVQLRRHLRGTEAAPEQFKDLEL